jgi:hypothetical protein
MDAYLDDTFDSPLLKEKQLALLMERRQLEDERSKYMAGENSVAENILEYLELLKSAPLTYETGNREQKRQLVKTFTSNLSASGKKVAVELRSPFREIAEVAVVASGAPVRNDPRTFPKRVLEVLLCHFTTIDERQPSGGTTPLHSTVTKVSND